ncbi:unnamed protein product [Cuscuta campestris]|uniref:Uncharacterized protein n=1 Tax=Cuscuta campestris TaxID=132261 RepID=A0A484M9C3_9ASTE|nr:unnamed protein product [Cuscuta campestris]
MYIYLTDPIETRRKLTTPVGDWVVKRDIADIADIAGVAAQKPSPACRLDAVAAIFAGAEEARWTPHCFAGKDGGHSPPCRRCYPRRRWRSSPPPLCLTGNSPPKMEVALRWRPFVAVDWPRDIALPRRCWTSPEQRESPEAAALIQFVASVRVACVIVGRRCKGGRRRCRGGGGW